MAARLPPESSLVQALAGEPAHWSISDYLLANVVDGLNYLLYAYVSANSKSRPRQPEPTYRPALPTSNKPQRMSTSNEVAAFFGSEAIHVDRR